MLRHAVRAAMFAAILSISLSAQTSGWKVHTDPSQSASDPDNTPQLKFMTMGKGFHVVSGPAGTYWHPSNTATGNYTLKANFNLLTPSNHLNYYGLVFGGKNLDGPTQSYAYFVIGQNGTFQVRQRNGANVTTVTGPTANAAIKTPAAGGSATNTLEVRVAGDTVSYVVNGTVVHSGPKGSLVTDGLAGFRINHVLSVHVEDFAIGK
jgi:hypothetical protein